MSKTKQTPSRRCAVASGWPGLVFVLGSTFFRTVGYSAFIMAGVFVSNQTGFLWYAGACIIGHCSICFSDAVAEAEKPDSDDEANSPR